MGAAENTDIVMAARGDHSTIEKHLLAVTEAAEADRHAVLRALVEPLVRHEVAEEVGVYPYASARPSAPTHPHPSVPDTPPRNRLGGPVASLFDRMRDSTSNG